MKLKPRNGNVSKIQRTQRDDFVFKSKKSNLSKTDGFRTLIQNPLWEIVTVPPQKHDHSNGHIATTSRAAQKLLAAGKVRIEWLSAV